MNVFTESMSTPAGLLHIGATEEAVIAVVFGPSIAPTLKKIALQIGKSIKHIRTSNHITNFAARELQAYFSGKLATFSVPLHPIGTTFQMKTWKALSKIPFGKTISYGAQAHMIGKKKAARAVGGANGKNPICVIIPCHRVIAGDGTIGGYTGGLEIKRKLLRLEGVLL